EIDEMLQRLNWDEMFGASTFPFKNIRRKADARAYPSRLEFGLARGIVPPSSLNNGQQVDLLVGQIAAPYFDMQSFDDLPTPFRAVAVDLLSATPVVMDRGSFATAMRATMSLPLVFPPVERDGRMLVDGGMMNNVPADVVRGMGARTVIAVNVGDLSDRAVVNQSLFAVGGASLDAMMRANTKLTIKQADIVIDVPLGEFGSLDWRRSDALIIEGYKAAEAMRDRLLPLAVSPEEYTLWQTARNARRSTSLPAPAFLRVEGFSSSDERQLTTLLARHVGADFNAETFQADVAVLSGLDRYESITWLFVKNAAGENGMLVQARAKSYGPPFMMLGLNLENTTSEDFRVTFTGRYLAFDVLGSGSELRIDGTLGSDPGLGLSYYRPFGGSPLFVEPYAGMVHRTFSVIEEDAVVASYGQTLTRGGIDVGVNLGRVSDLRFGTYIGRLKANVDVGDPGLPEVNGKEVVSELNWRYDSQDSPVVPSRGSYASSNLHYVFDGPEISPPLPSGRSNAELLQLSGEISHFWPSGEKGRFFALGGGGTSFGNQPLPTDQFALGRPFHLGAHDQGEFRGDHYYIATGGYLHQFGRLPDFMGGPLFLGAWLENGDAFNTGDAAFRTNASGGVILDTLVGPVILAGSAGFDGSWRTYIGVGRIFGRRRE
ncbi:MAG TPA: patatin-like phospholipase family protein, partial [Sphingomicrobium sp.]|nr:patatin-like phospholipase family protein [Sphingomicrobium sp.]